MRDDESFAAIWRNAQHARTRWLAQLFRSGTARAYLVIFIWQVLALIIIIGGILMIPAYGATPDEWLELVAAIQRQPCPYKENRDDRAFLGRMANVLTLDEPPELTWRERRWLLTLKKECKL